MTSKNVTNNHNAPLRVGGVQINAGATVRIDNWQNVESSKAVGAWVNADVLTLSDAAEAPTPFPPAAAPGGGSPFPPAAKPKTPGFSKDHSNDPDGAEKDKLIAELKELTGVEKTRASGLESLRKQVEAAKAGK